MKATMFWPLDYDPEGEVYDSVSWGLPGFRGSRRPARKPERAGSGRPRDIVRKGRKLTSA